MVMLVRVDDRLLHGQIICSWVPHVKAEMLVVASDEAAGDEMAREIISSCAHDDLKVVVESVAEAVRDVADGSFDEARTILIVGDLEDARRLYADGVRFSTLNVGNLHHERDGQMVTPSVIVDPEDEVILEEFTSLGVELDIRAVPASPQGKFVPRRRSQA